VRLGIRALCKRRLTAETRGDVEEQAARFQAAIESLRASAIAIHTDAANAQHYELPPAFFKSCLGKRLKYSCAYFERGNEHLDQAEIHAVSNSRSQREFIEAECRRLRIGNVGVTVEDVNRLQLPAANFDRCVSVEMFGYSGGREWLVSHYRFVRPA
jgi:cyclopropane-fatty-acyl-phospholipid synthase